MFQNMGQFPQEGVMSNVTLELIYVYIIFLALYIVFPCKYLLDSVDN